MTPIEQIRKSIFGGIQPKGIVMNLINKSNPMASKLIGMAENGDSKGVETFARNLLKEKGLDYDKEMASFKEKLGIK